MMEVTCEVPLRSALGPFLWNVVFDVVFWLLIPRGDTSISHVDNMHVVLEGDVGTRETVADPIQDLDSAWR